MQDSSEWCEFSSYEGDALKMNPLETEIVAWWWFFFKMLKIFTFLVFFFIFSHVRQ